MQERRTKKRFFCIFCNFLCPLFAFPASCSQMQVFITDIIKSFRDTISRLHRHKRENKYFVGFINMKVMDKKLANSTSKCKITKCFCKSTPLVLRNSISFLVSH